jgi:hypothetical protein
MSDDAVSHHTTFDRGLNQSVLRRSSLDALDAVRCRLEARSGGSLKASVQTRVRANASSGGHVEIVGNPAERDFHSSSGGHVAMH